MFWKVFDRRKTKIKCLAVITFVFFIAGFLLLDCFCSEKKCSWNSSASSKTQFEPQYKSLSYLSAVNNFSEEDLDKHFEFNQDTDVFVFLHIQKTGGTNFGLNLVKNTSLKEPCVCFENRKRCDCRTSKNYLWIISRHSNGWVCGLHADWTELHDCVPGYLNRVDGIERRRRYFYFTILRDPLQRYLSEWKHVQRGSTWITAKLNCGGRRATRKEVPLCFKGKNWMNVSLDEFTSCSSNLAHNRQTRMVADLRLVGCYDKNVIPNDSVRNKIMLQSAKDNLRSMEFFGLTEYQAETSFLFEYTFGIKFTINFTQVNETRASKAEISKQERDRLHKLNALDIELYSYARDLFLARVYYARMKLSESKRSLTKLDENVGETVLTDDVDPNRHPASKSSNVPGFSSEGGIEESPKYAMRHSVGHKNRTQPDASRDEQKFNDGGYGYSDDDNDNPPYNHEDDYDIDEHELGADPDAVVEKFQPETENQAHPRGSAEVDQGAGRSDEAGDGVRSGSSTMMR